MKQQQKKNNKKVVKNDEKKLTFRTRAKRSSTFRTGARKNTSLYPVGLFRDVSPLPDIL